VKSKKPAPFKLTAAEVPLDAAIRKLWAQVKPLDLELGKLLYQMHTSLAKRGCKGGFTAYLGQLGMPRSTAYDRLNRYADSAGLPYKGKVRVTGEELGNGTDPYGSEDEGGLDALPKLNGLKN
jgi:hypothetical protein